MNISLSKKLPIPQGGTELMVAGLHRHVPADLLSQVYLSVSVIHTKARHLKPHIFWAHQSYDQPSVQNLRDNDFQSAIDGFVFVSQWQKEQYQRHFGIPHSKSFVIKNAIEPILVHKKPAGKIKLVYTSTPFRGLDVLLEAFSLVKQTDVELHIYSGMQLYGRPEENARFTELYSQAEALPNVYYHGVVSNQEVRKALQKSHIFAYPSTWEETSCVALIEALCAGCLPVIPKFAALPETAGRFGLQYECPNNRSEHITRFRAELEKAVASLTLPKTQRLLQAQVRTCNENYGWERRKLEWENLITKVIKSHV